jgi:hypothetical protein
VLFDKMYTQAIAYTKIIREPKEPEYTFPRQIQKELS